MKNLLKSWWFWGIAGMIAMSVFSSSSSQIPSSQFNSQPSIAQTQQLQPINSETKQIQQTNTITDRPTTPTQPSDGLSNNNYYTNTYGNRVHSPAYETNPNVVPSGASARCGDGTYSFSQSRRGTCSHHGGVAEWL